METTITALSVVTGLFQDGHLNNSKFYGGKEAETLKKLLRILTEKEQEWIKQGQQGVPSTHSTIVSLNEGPDKTPLKEYLKGLIRVATPFGNDAKARSKGKQSSKKNDKESDETAENADETDENADETGENADDEEGCLSSMFECCGEDGCLSSMFECCGEDGCLSSMFECFGEEGCVSSLWGCCGEEGCLSSLWGCCGEEGCLSSIWGCCGGAIKGIFGCFSCDSDSDSD